MVLLTKLDAPFLSSPLLQSGTLGGCFLATIDGQKKFIKTNIIASGLETLRKEAILFQFLYGDVVSIEVINTCDLGYEQTWMVMDQLNPLLDKKDMPARVLKLTREYLTKLQQFKHSEIIPPTDNFDYLLVAASNSLVTLSRADQLSSTTRERLVSSFDLLQKHQSELSPCICHGDLGPQNIMQNDKDLVPIDWEDAFWGFDGYDYLYWLTFFENRKYYSDEIFNKTRLGKPLEVAVMAVILLLKSEISWHAGTYHNNSLSFDQRLAEIFAL